MGKGEPFTLGGRFYTSDAALERDLRAIKSRHPEGTTLQGDEFALLADFLLHKQAGRAAAGGCPEGSA